LNGAKKGVRFVYNIPAENGFSRYAAFVEAFGNVQEIFEVKTLGRV
jgi:hypothetical protein